MENTCGFVHLHNHTMYSLLDGAIRPKDLIKCAVEWGMGAVALTDHGNMFGAVDLYMQAKNAGIKAIIGSEVYVAIDSRFKKESTPGNIDSSHHLVLLAATNQGYKNLMKIVSAGYVEGFYYKPRVDKAYLREHAEGLIALSACIGGEVPRLAIQGHLDRAEAAALEYNEIFGAGNFFLELQRHGIPEEEPANAALIDIAKKTGIPLVATNDAHYLKAEHSESHEVLLCISTGKTLDDQNRMKMETDQLYLKTPDEMKALFADVPEAIENTVRIAERCEVSIKTGEYNPVQFTVPEGFAGDTNEYLAHIAREGLVRRYGDDAEQYRERLEYELGIIKAMGFSDYFLAIYDCTRYASEVGIPVGTARGSAGGSIVAYAIGITNLDPMRYGLIFERFLNPERVSMPDFDVDYADRDRGRMIDYVKEKYGSDHVCQIITFGTMKAKLVVRDVGRVLGMPYGEVDAIAKLIPNDLGTTLDSAFDLVPELRELEKNNPQAATLFRHARILEGLSRHAGTHAAGVIITPGPCTEYLPLYMQGEDITSQYTMEYVEKIGCLKVDFLGLRTLSVIKDAIDLVRETGSEIDIDHIPMDDPAVYKLMSRGDTIGVFQFESGGMRDYLRKLQPTCIEDLIAMNALYRPGPLGSNMVDDFIDRKHGRKALAYPHPLLEDILKETYGVIVYQEQVMKIANVMAGFSLGGADQLRRAMGKKKAEVMVQMRHQFVEGAKAKNIDERIASEVFDLMAHFAGYGFNKSHSAGYAILAYQTAWLKAHYPAQFMAAALTSEMDNTDRIVILIEECRNMNIQVLPPDVNRSFAEFTVEEGNVRFGMGGVKNVGRNAIEAIVQARKAAGPFTSIFDFCSRVDLKSLNKRVIESLVMAGSMDSLWQNRGQLFVAINDAVEYAQARQREQELGQFSLFGEGAPESSASTPSLPPVADWTRTEMLSNEKSVLGFWFSGHPLEGYTEELKAFATPIRQLMTKADRTPVTIGGVVTSVTRKTSKKNDKPFMVARIEDMEGSCDVIFMNGAFDTYKNEVTVDSMLLIEGTVSNRSDSDQPGIFADKTESLAESREKRTRAVNISLVTAECGEALLKPLVETCEKYPGDLTLWITLRTRSSGTYQIRANRYKVSHDPGLIRDLKRLLGQSHVWIS
jgi:DNA polymerase III subunit alpha